MTAPLPFHLLDASRIVPNLYQGSRPTPGGLPARCGFRIIAFCEREWQPVPAGQHFPGVQAIHVPLADEDPLTDQTIFVARRGAKMLAHALREPRQRALVVCHAGLNRSGLVVALTIRELTGLSGKRCRQIVQACRHGALVNEAFTTSLDGMPEG